MGNIGPDCLLLVEDSDCAWRASRVYETRLYRIKLEMSRSHTLIHLW